MYSFSSCDADIKCKPYYYTYSPRGKASAFIRARRSISAPCRRFDSVQLNRGVTDVGVGVSRFRSNTSTDVRICSTTCRPSG